jgi:catechol 2,3-dioxygenase
VVGLTVVGRIFNGRAAVLSSGQSHHELLLIQVTTADGPLTDRRIGLYHAGWKIGDSLEDLRQALDRAQTYDAPVDGTVDHGMMFSLYLRDPDDNEVELFVDNPDCDWRRDTSWMEAPVKPLDLSAAPRSPSRAVTQGSQGDVSQLAAHTAS